MTLSKWLIATVSLIVLIALTIYVGATGAFFIDDEQSYNDSLGFQWGFVILDDDFEGTPWDDAWNENGTTSWVQTASLAHSGTYSAMSGASQAGYLTSDEIDASESENITVRFWFRPHNLEVGDVTVQMFNGSSYVTLFDLRNYATYVNDTWCQFSEIVNSAQYLIPGFRIRFDSSVISGDDIIYIDEVTIVTDSDPPVIPTGFVATAGDTKVFLGWNANTDIDLEGYNLYRSTTNGTGHTIVNGSVITTTNFTDTSLINDTSYYYILRAVDLAGNESLDSSQVSATPTDLAPEIPTGLTAIAGDTTVELDWEDNTDYDFHHYNVYRSETSGSGYVKINSGDVTSSQYSDTGLTNDTTYYYVVTATDNTSNPSGYSNEAYATPTDLAPAIPAGLFATAGDRQVSLDWTDNTDYDFAGYNVYRSTVSGSGYAKINGSLVGTSNFTDTERTGGTTYYYVVTAVDATANESVYSAEDSATPYDDPPDAPTGLVAAADDRHVDLSWNPNTETDLDGYNVYRSTTSGTGYSKINTTLVTGTSYQDSGLSGGITYYYVIKAVDDLGQASSYSSQASATPFDSAPATPTGVTANATDRAVFLDWNDNTETDLSGYNLYRSLFSGSGYTKINTTILTSSNYTDTGLTGGTTYYYVVKAVDQASQSSGYSTEVNATPYDTPPAAPTGLDATPDDATAILDWDDNTEDDLDGYNVYRSLSSGSGYAKVNTVIVETSNYTDTGLTGGTTYYYVVTAVDNGANESSYSNEDSTTPTDPPPTAPTGLTAVPHDASVTLDWNDNVEGDLDGYYVYRSLSSGFGYTKINGMTYTSDFTDSTVSNNTTYYYVVTAVDITTSESVPSVEKSATPNATPAAPTGLSAAAGDRQALLTWNTHPEGDVIGYNVYRSLTSGSGYSMINGSLVTTENYTDSGLVGGTTYYYVITAIDSIANMSSFSTEDSVIPYDAAPNAPTGLFVTSGDRQVSLDWNDNSEDDFAHYNVYRSTTSGSGYVKVNTANVTVSNYIDTGLTGGTTYYYVVTAVDALANESSNSGEDSATPTDADPASPSGLVATPGDKQISLNWSDNTEDDIAGYNIYRSLTSGSGYVKQNGGLLTSSDYLDTGLVGGTTYYYVVTAVDDAANEGTYSNEAYATAQDADPAAPTGLTASSGEELVSLDWNDNTDPDLDGYNVYRSTTSGSGYTKLNTISLVATSSYTDTNLTPGVTYYYVVTAVDLGENESSYSNEDSAIPAGPTMIDDGFEGTPWYDYWDDNGVGGWMLSSTSPHSDSYSAQTDRDHTGALTSDNLYALVTTSISIDFWYYPSSIEAGDVLFQAWNGSTWNTLYDLYSYPGFTNNTWCEFNDVLTDSQYFKADFKVRFTSIASGNDIMRIDDVLIVTDNLPPLTPTALVATAGEQQVSLNWDDNIEVDLAGYNVYRSLTSGSGYSKLNGTPVENSNYIDTGLSNGTTYYYVVTAVDLGTNESGYSTEDDATPTDVAPSAPTGLVATPGDELVELDWTDNPELDINHYDVYRSTTSGSGYAFTGNTTTSNFTDTGLTGGTTYYFVVKAVDDAAQPSTNSAEVSATPNDPPPAAPTGLAASSGDRQIGLTWNANSEGDLNGYNVYRSLTSGSGFAKINTSIVGTASYTDTGLVGGTTYYYLVTAVDTGSNESDNSTESSATPTDAAPSAPTGLAATPGDRQASLNWNDNTEDDFDGYNVYRSTTSGSGYIKVNTSLLSSSSYVDTGLTGYTTYYWVVTAVDQASNESAVSGEATAMPTDIPPDPPTGLNVETGDAHVQLDWNDNTEDDLAGYDVYRSTDNTTYGQINGSLILTSDYLDTPLVGGITYYYKVKAIDDGGHESDFSDEEATPPDWKPSAPTGLVATPHDASVSLDWNDNPEGDIDYYLVYRSETSGSGYSQTGNVTVSNFTDTGLTNETTYYYVVKAVDLAGQPSENYSNEDSATPNLTPSAPTGLVATGGDRQIGLTWNANPEGDVIGYNLYRSITAGSGYTKLNGDLITTENYTNTNLTGGITFYYLITAVDSIYNESANSTEASATTSDALPSAPTGLTATPGDKQISLDWNDNTEDDLDGYNVYRSLTSGSGYAKINGSLVTSSAYLDTGLTGGTTYYYIVTAIDEASQEGPASTEASTTATDAPPAAPTGLAASAGDKQVSLDWNDNGESDLNSYNVYRSLTSGSGYSKIAGNVTVSQYLDSPLVGGTTYYYVVTAVDDNDGESSYSTEDNAVPTDPAPSAPTSLTATPHDANVVLDWADNGESDLAGYNVYRSTTSGSGYAKINGSLVSPSTYTDSTASNDTTYYYVVTAVDAAAHESGYSTEDSTTPNATPSAPTGLVATPGNRQVSLDWNDNAEGDILGYNVYRSLTSVTGFTKINVSIVESSAYTDVSLTNGTTYFYRVTAVDTIYNESTASTEDSATPVGITLLNDGFQGSPWYGNWDNNGATDWETGSGYNSTVSALHKSGDTYLTSDNLNTSTAGTVTVSFWFRIKHTGKGPGYIQLYNGSTYTNWYNLFTYPGVSSQVWVYFTQTITDAQYFRSDFRLRFDGSSSTTDINIDDVLVVMN